MGKTDNKHAIKVLSPNLGTAIKQIRDASRPLDPEKLRISVDLLELWKMNQIVSQRGSALLRVLMSAVSNSTVYADTDLVQTAAVTMPGSTPILIINPEFFSTLSNEGAAFVLSHEMYHLVLGHLSSYQTFAMRKRELGVVAREAMINRLIMRQTRKGMPEKNGVTQKLVNPEELYSLYVKTAKECGVEPVSEVAFFNSELSIYSAIADLPKPMSLPEHDCDTEALEQQQAHDSSNCPSCQNSQTSSKSSQKDSGGSSQGNSGKSSQEDSDESSEGNSDESSQEDSDESSEGNFDESSQGNSDGSSGSPSANSNGRCECSCHGSNNGAKGSLVERALSQLQSQANDSDVRDGAADAQEKAKQLLEDLMAATPESKSWGNISAGITVGSTTEERKTAMWEKAVAHLASTLLAHFSSRLTYDRKSGAVGPRLARKGRDKTKIGFFFADTSGSMYGGPIERLISLIGQENNIEMLYRTFDTDVYVHEIGQELQGGGGTNFKILQDYLDSQALDPDGVEEPDFILVFTDGYAESFVPTEPNKWVVVLTPNGTEKWPEDANLAWYRLDASKDELN